MSNRTQILSALREISGSAGVLDTPADMAKYAQDWRGEFRGTPLCVVRPTTTQDVAKVVQYCAKMGIKIVPQGGNTGLAGGATPNESGEQIILSLSRMTKIRQFDPFGMSVSVEAGAILATVKSKTRQHGLHLPISLAAEGSATIGGVVATNAGGTNVLRYGMTRAFVLGLEVVLADGTIVDGMKILRKNNAGYDWKQAFIGSEGTLGIVTAAVLRLVSQPNFSETALVSVSSVDATLMFYRMAQDALGETLSAFELMSVSALRRSTAHLNKTAPICLDGIWYLLIEAESSLGALRPAFESLLEQGFEQDKISDGVIAETLTQAQNIWALREGITEAEAASGKSVKHDISVPHQQMTRFLESAEKAIENVFPDAELNIFGHLGDGNLHFNVIVERQTDSARLNTLVHDLVASCDGSISAEHGIGQYRVAEHERLQAPAEALLRHRLKVAFDPENQMNPAKVLSFHQ